MVTDTSASSYPILSTGRKDQGNMQGPTLTHRNDRCPILFGRRNLPLPSCVSLGSKRSVLGPLSWDTLAMTSRSGSSAKKPESTTQVYSPPRRCPSVYCEFSANRILQKQRNPPKIHAQKKRPQTPKQGCILSRRMYALLLRHGSVLNFSFSLSNWVPVGLPNIPHDSQVEDPKLHSITIVLKIPTFKYLSTIVKCIP